MSHLVSVGQVRRRRVGLFPRGPTLQGDDQDGPCHQQADQARGDREHEHGVQAVVVHCDDGVAALSDLCQQEAVNTVVCRETPTLAIKSTPPEMRPKAVSNSVGGREGKIDRGGFRYIKT